MVRGRRLEWWSLFWLGTVIAVVGLVTGQSQAMRSAWIEDCLSLLPPTFFLLATWFEGRAPTRRFPFGFDRAASLAFFAAATVLLAFGAILFYEAVATLIRREHPVIGSIRLLGQEVWFGWLMIGALTYSIVPPVVLGHLKQRPAKDLNDKVLVTDSEMNKADWQTGVAGILGILGIAWGLWWADAAAAGLISLSILWDGVGAFRRATAELVDGAPRDLHQDRIDDEAQRLMDRAQRMGVSLCLRETGRIITGIVESDDPQDLARLTEGLSWRVRGLSWRPRGSAP
ncbi:cobalt transporter [Rubellimicrobium rubrum]|uniref:Cobalt transporter n=2 Tax=Rubellimicrobium rubrum TaxID=2585369 RepID=A0A5C4MSI7_9RHOB|nr:cobalt transporter [Rubellimicrobium rubrum]